MSFVAVVTLHAMDYEQAREQALFLTDKMAYELNLNDQQYEDCYEINLDYLLSVQTADDVYGNYLIYRNADLRHILFDWQYSIFATTDYFFHPLLWYRGAWSFPIYRYYTYGHFFYDRPAVFWHYRGGHGRHYFHAGFYASRRPHRWNGGFRGHDCGPVAHRGDFGRASGHGATRSGRSGHADRFGRGDHAHNNGVGHTRSGYSIGNSRTAGRDAGRSHDDTYSLGRSAGTHAAIGSTRSADSFSRSRGDNNVGGYNHPSSTRTTVGTSVGHQGSTRSSSFSSAGSRSGSLTRSTPSISHSSRSGSYSGHSSSRSSYSGRSSRSSGSFSGATRSSGSFSGGSRGGGSFGGGSRSGGFSGGSRGGSSRGGGRGR